MYPACRGGAADHGGKCDVLATRLVRVRRRVRSHRS
ncbi:hypothetical protein STVIR_7051 [Streptomyces viridochromogenes Tue57]|uniref:Uncharacterized protein n=1 Tax=Streptomyces viridochromogenes Tue57 TaxID=1160705 RepID=L8P720_STRVR|nr:hypothetical protein STVIR_7051 [Streptomyces viridochromogenes Tue57]